MSKSTCDLLHDIALQVLALYQDKLLTTDSFAGFCEVTGKSSKGSKEVGYYASPSLPAGLDSVNTETFLAELISSVV